MAAGQLLHVRTSSPRVAWSVSSARNSASKRRARPLGLAGRVAGVFVVPVHISQIQLAEGVSPSRVPEPPRRSGGMRMPVAASLNPECSAASLFESRSKWRSRTISRSPLSSSRSRRLEPPAAARRGCCGRGCQLLVAERRQVAATRAVENRGRCQWLFAVQVAPPRGPAVSPVLVDHRVVRDLPDPQGKRHRRAAEVVIQSLALP